jgi:transcriptional regulator with XRE-family HTH domain
MGGGRLGCGRGRGHTANGELGLSQREVVKRAKLSKQTVGEIARNSEQRDRYPRTLEALSVALEWHAGHLSAILEGRIPPEVGAPHVKSGDDVPGRLDNIEYRLGTLTALVEETLTLLGDRFDELVKVIVAPLQQEIARLRRAGR